MDTASDHGLPDVPALEAAAERLGEDILQRWGDRDNVWRTAWAMDTLLDYFRVLGKDGSAYGQRAIDALDPKAQGNWWDDFGWIGIAALRAAEQDTFPAQREQMLKIAINAWAYMYGPGWSVRPTRDPFPFVDADLTGWKDFGVGHRDNIGALNVWNRIDQTFSPGRPTDDQKYRQHPRFSPGGAWNAPIENADSPLPVLDYTRPEKSAYLNPVQNTVTNGLFSLFALRILRASGNPDFRAVFDRAGLDPKAYQTAWNHQAEWLSRWCTAPELSADQRLIMSPGGVSGAALIRERVSTYLDTRRQPPTVYWDSAYIDDLVWTGDQGLILAVLREGVQAGATQSIFGRAQEIVAGVFHTGFAERDYGGSGAKAQFLLPWIALDAKGDARFTAVSPGDGAHDNDDYLTGVAVFMRYLLQAHEADPHLLPAASAETILRSAAAMCRPGFGDSPGRPYGICDGFFRAPDTSVNELTPRINQLSTLLTAIAIARAARTASG